MPSEKQTSFSSAHDVAVEFDQWAQTGRGEKMATGHRYATQQSIDLGVCKFNVNTEVRLKYFQFWREYGQANDKTDLLDCQKAVTAAMQVVIAEKIRLFGSAGKA